MRRAPRAGASWRSARPRCGCWKPRPATDGQLRAFAGETAIFITPGYQFRAVDLMLTNFHLPRSTLFMLVAAFSGLETMKRAYAHAIEAGYRFYSYGDACLLYPAAAHVPTRARERDRSGAATDAGDPAAFDGSDSPDARLHGCAPGHDRHEKFDA